MTTTEILKTLSDTELIALAVEINNPEISNEMILSQLSSKSNSTNNDISISDFSDKLSYELSLRLMTSNASRCKCD